LDTAHLSSGLSNTLSSDHWHRSGWGFSIKAPDRLEKPSADALSLCPMARLNHKLLIVIIFLAIPSVQIGSVNAQNGEVPAIIHFSKEQHPGQKQSWQIAQMENGLMVFANTAGLMIYDGVNWSLFEMPHQQIIRTILVDGQRIYVGSYGEFGYWAPDLSGQLNYHSLIHLLDRRLTSGEEIWNILKINNAIYFHSFGAVFKFEDQTLSQILPPHSIRFMHHVDNQQFALQVTGQGIMKFKSDTFTNFVPESETRNIKITGILRYLEDQILVATEKNGFFIYRENELVSWHTEVDQQLYNHQINKLLELSNQYWAIGTISDGLLIIDKEGRLIYHINKNAGLQNNTILALFEDAGHNLWVGMDDGIDLIDLNSSVTFYRDNSGQIGTVFDAIEFQDDLYIGTNQGLFMKVLSSEDRNSDFTLIPGTQGQVLDLQLVDGDLFCGHNNGTFVVSEGRVKQISQITGGWYMLPIKGVDGKLIQGTYTGLITFNKSEGQWHFGNSISGFNGVVKQLAFDQENWLWAVNPYRGLHRLKIDFERDSIIAIQSFDQLQGLPTDYNISLMHFDDQLLFRCAQRYFTFDFQQGVFLEYPLPFPDIANIRKIMPGPDQSYFLVREDHLEIFDGDQLQAKFNLDLVQGSENLIPLKNRKYLVCLEDGYAIIDPRSSQVEKPENIVTCIANFMAWDRSGKLTYSLAGQIIPIPEPIELSPQINRIEFNFASFDFADNRRFRYQLQGFDPEWSPWTTVSRKEYTNLAPGNYSLNLQYEGRDPVEAIKVVQVPAWHQTTIARFLFLSSFGLLAWLLLKYYDRRLAVHTRRLEIEKGREMNRQRLALQNEMLEKEINHKNKELANSTMNIIQKNKVLLQIREQIAGVRSNPGRKFHDRQYHQLIRMIQQNMSSQDDWKVFETNFNDVHDNFFKMLKIDFPDLTSGDLKLAAYLKMNLSTKEIAPLLNISIRGVENKRYRLRLKMGLEHDENLLDVLLKY
jgi:ligand-binding sensor domain-containing protein/DNA-binding CsgD family transcriptional regulator